MWLGDSERVFGVIHDHLRAHHLGNFPSSVPVSKSGFEQWHSTLSSEMQRTTHFLFRKLKYSSPQRVTPPLLPALTGQSSLRHGHQVVRRTMSQYKYADVRCSNAKKRGKKIGDKDVDIA